MLTLFTHWESHGYPLVEWKFSKKNSTYPKYCCVQMFSLEASQFFQTDNQKHIYVILFIQVNKEYLLGNKRSHWMKHFKEERLFWLVEMTFFSIFQKQLLQKERFLFFELEKEKKTVEASYIVIFSLRISFH